MANRTIAFIDGPGKTVGVRVKDNLNEVKK